MVIMLDMKVMLILSKTLSLTTSTRAHLSAIKGRRKREKILKIALKMRLFC